MSGISLEKRIDNSIASGKVFAYKSNPRTLDRLTLYALRKGFRVFVTPGFRSIRVKKPLVAPPSDFLIVDRPTNF